jgi:hypothetical protein
MAKMVELRLRGLTCEFSPDDGSSFDLTGQFTALALLDSGAVSETKIIFDFPDGPIRMRQGVNVALDREVRVTLHTLEDPPGSAKSVKFGGDLNLVGLLWRESEWQTLHTNDLTNPEPRMWRFYFGRNDRIVRADISVRVAHHL